MFDPMSANASHCFAVVATSVLAQDHSSEQSQAQITDPKLECTVYSYGTAAQNIHNFPPIWQPATLLASNSDGQALWSIIASGVPNIIPKGQLNGSTINVTYDLVNDPDCRWTAHQCTTPKISGLPPDISSIPEPKSMGYAFDDGPNCTHNIFYNYLPSQNQKAIMFYIGSGVLDLPLHAQRALADGHEICAHTWSHRYMTAFASQDAFAELWYSIKAIKLITGITPTCWRPPYGDVDDRIRYIANALGLQTIVWKYDLFDLRVGLNNITAADVDNNYGFFINILTTGAYNTVRGIMLTHELNNFTVQKAVKWYPQLKSFSYLVPIGAALNKTRPYVETNYSLPTFQQCSVYGRPHSGVKWDSSHTVSFADISGQVTAAGNATGSGTTNGPGTSSSSSASSSPSTGTGDKKSSAVTIRVSSSGTWWILLSAGMLLSGVLL